MDSLFFSFFASNAIHAVFLVARLDSAMNDERTKYINNHGRSHHAVVEVKANYFRAIGNLNGPIV